jgi:hypothetical protein
MAKNTGKKYRQGAVRKRSQFKNPVTDQHLKRDTTTGRIIDASDNRFKGVREEK